MPCMCGACDCPSCGPAQGYDVRRVFRNGRYTWAVADDEDSIFSEDEESEGDLMNMTKPENPAMRAAAPRAAPAQSREPIKMLTDEQIREIFLLYGFTIKDWLTDLKPYVYAAARAVIAEFCKINGIRSQP